MSTSAPHAVPLPAPAPTLDGWLRAAWSWRLQGLVTVGWLALAYAEASFGVATRERLFVQWDYFLPFNGGVGLFAAAFTPIVAAWAQWLAARPGWRPVLGHVAGALVVAAATTALRRTLGCSLVPCRPSSFVLPLVQSIDLDVAHYTLAACIGLAVEQHRRWRTRALRALRLEAQIAGARLRFLRQQLQPHFLFNCLHAISEYAHEAPATAEQMVRHLRALLRRAAGAPDHGEVALADELAALATYTDLQRARFGDWLRVRVDASDAARGARVPAMLLQPLVENAIQHGFADRAQGGVVTVEARTADGRLLLRVRDDGMGLRPSRQLREGIGLQNTRRRLETMYGPRHRFDLRPAAPSGTEVVIELPLEPAADALLPEDGGHEDEPPDEPTASAPAPLRSGPRVGAVLAFWALMGVVWTIQRASLYRLVDYAPSPQIGALNLWTAALWVPLTPLALRLARAVRFTARGWPLAVLVHAAAAVTFAIGHIALLQLAKARAMAMEASPFHPLAPANRAQLVWNTVFYLIIVTWVSARALAAARVERELTGARLDATLADARWQALRVQLRPALVLDALDRLAVLVRQDAMAAERLIARLADLLRQLLDRAEERETSVEVQLGLLAAYVDVHAASSAPVTLDARVAEGSEAVLVPNGLLLAAMEDLLDARAAAPGAGARTVRVDVAREAAGLRLDVHRGAPAAGDAEIAWPRARAAAAVTSRDRPTSIEVAAGGVTIRCAAPLPTVARIA